MEMNKKSKIGKTSKLKIKQDMTIINASGLMAKMEDTFSSSST